jgi:signal peptidase I
METTQTPELREKKTFVAEIIDFIKFVIVALIIIVPIRTFIAQPFIVNGDSMLPTFESGDYLIINEITYRTTDPERGEVIVFRYPGESKRFLIKRIIGLPGEHIKVAGSTVTITKVDGSIVTINEPYINESFSSYGTWQLNDDEYFVMGDNRNASSDSRSWGVLHRDRIVGKTLLRLFPISGIESNPGTYESSIIEQTN